MRFNLSILAFLTLLFVCFFSLFLTYKTSSFLKLLPPIDLSGNYVTTAWKWGWGAQAYANTRLLVTERSIPGSSLAVLLPASQSPLDTPTIVTVLNTNYMMCFSECYFIAGDKAVRRSPLIWYNLYLRITCRIGLVCGRINEYLGNIPIWLRACSKQH